MYFYVPAADVSVLPREMSRSDRGVRNREALSVCPELVSRAQKKETGEQSSISKKRASDRNGGRRFRSPSGDVTQ